MAEQVQAILDEMAAPLSDLQERGIFTASEIKATVSRRREMEYLLRRRQPRKVDYLRYLRHEHDLEVLRRLRSKVLPKKRPHETNDEQSKHIGDKHILQHLHLLWVRTLRKYRSDLSLFTAYAAVCKEFHSYRRLAACYQEALRYHPHATQIWLEAASHEYFDKNNVSSARILLQRGLRINEASADLWVQAMALELHWVQKLKGRKAILRPELKTGDEEDDTRTTATAPATVSATVPATEKSHQSLAQLVYENAIQSRADSVELRCRCLEQCQLFPETQSLEAYILQSMVEGEFGKDTSAWIACASYLASSSSSRGEKQPSCFLAVIPRDECEPHSKKKEVNLAVTDRLLDAVLKTLREGCTKLQTEDMFRKAIHFLHSYGANQEGDGESDNDDSEHSVDSNLQLKENSKALMLELFCEAATSDFYSPILALQHAEFLAKELRVDDAIEILENFVKKAKDKTELPWSLWSRWAWLLHQKDESMHEVFAVLERALAIIPMHRNDYMAVLLQLFGAKLSTLFDDHDSLQEEIFELFERVLLLSPGVRDKIENNLGFASVTSVPTACLHYLVTMTKFNDEDFRKVYKAVIFQSKSLEELLHQDLGTMKAFLDACIDFERKRGQKEKLHRLFTTAIDVFDKTPTASEYKAMRNDERFRTKSPLEPLNTHNLYTVPSLDLDADSEEHSSVEALYKASHVLHIENVAQKFKPRNDTLEWKDLGHLFDALDESDKKTWCLETKSNNAIPPLPGAFLASNSTTHRAYSSFLLQKDKHAYSDTVARLPFSGMPSLEWEYEKAVWFFFGRNPLGNPNLDGRPEHTDSVSHDGTWHYQLSGRKQWFLRPTKELCKILGPQFLSLSTERSYQVDCREGDVLILNTRLWFHRTVIPPQGQPSVSYARDFRFSAASPVRGGNICMQNVDGLYATDDIAAGDVLFSENEMPNCELHRSTTNANCEVVELEDGSGAVVATRKIAAGEFFCVPQSSEDEDMD